MPLPLSLAVSPQQHTAFQCSSDSGWCKHLTPYSKKRCRSFRLLSHHVQLAKYSRDLTVESFDIHNRVVPYEVVTTLLNLLHAIDAVSVSLTADKLVCLQAWKWQQATVKALLDSEDPSKHNKLLILQHEPVITLGAGSTEDNLNFEAKSPPLPLYRTERGGEVTFHGPGQLVVYPILNLQHFQTDLHWYLRSLEEVVIRCAHIAFFLSNKL